MTAVWRFVLALLIFVLVMSGFLLGIAQYPDRSHAPFIGVISGLFSAACWGCTTIVFDRWKVAEIDGTIGLLNLTAAVFAAIAVGYLAPEETCPVVPTKLAFQNFVCSFYARS